MLGSGPPRQGCIQAHPLTRGHQCVGQDAEPCQHQRHHLRGPAAQPVQQQQDAYLGRDVHNPNEDREQEDVAAYGLQVQG